MNLTAADIEALERATLAAVAPERLEALPDWLLPMDHGTVGRARSAVPLSHEPPAPDTLDAIAARYRAAGHVPRFRLPETPAWAAAHAHLGAHGFVRQQPTWTQVAPLQALLAVPSHPQAVLDTRPDAAWMAMFLGEGLDPVDGASRSQALARATGTWYASLRASGQTLACGAASLGHGWLGVHGLRTAAPHRGRGYAGALMRAMAEHAQTQGIRRVFLQVDAHNAAALSLYGRMGFERAWCYAYWLPARA